MITIEKGIAYDNGKPIILHIIDVRPLEDYRLAATFADGTTKMYDVSPLLEYEAFRPLRDIKTFEGVALDHGIPTWESANVDLAPESIYKYGKVVEYT